MYNRYITIFSTLIFLSLLKVASKFQVMTMGIIAHINISTVYEKMITKVL